MADRFDEALDALSVPFPETSTLAQSLLEVVPVSGVAVSTLGDLLGAETLSATDERIARVDELQFDLSVGPCWDALASRAPVLEPDLLVAPTREWPALSDRLREEGIRAIFAFPLLVGPLKIGAIDMYRTEPGSMSEEHQEQVVLLSALVGRHVLRRALAQSDEAASGQTGTFSRRIVHQATGFVIAQLGVSAEDALLLIQGQAFAEDRSVEEVAEDIVTRRLRFSVEGNRIEDTL